MLLTNQFNQWIFWRTFNIGDTVYIVGHRDGWLAPGDSTNVDHPHGTFQMEVKSGAAGHPFLRPAGAHYRNDDEVIVTPDGKVLTVEEALTVQPDPGQRTEVLGTGWYFFDKRGFSSDTTDEITTTFSLQTTTTGTVAGKITNSSSAENAAGGSAEVSGKIPVKSAEIGVKFGATASSKVTAGTVRELTQTHGLQFQQNQSVSTKFQIPTKAGKITAVEFVWNRSFLTGRTTVAGTVIPWEVTTGLMASRSYREYASPAEMPAHVYAAFLDQFPLSGTSLFRQNTPMMIDGNTWIGLFIVTDIQLGGVFSGTVYGSPMSGSYSEGFGDLQFVRRISADYTQYWYAQTTQPNRINGYFTETINGALQGVSYGWSMAQSLLAMTSAGEVLRFSMNQISPDGQFSGMIGSDSLSGTWNQAAQSITFNRIRSDGSLQTWTGNRIAGLTFQGTHPNGGGTASWTIRPD
jgi:hypothetical protein